MAHLVQSRPAGLSGPAEALFSPSMFRNAQYAQGRGPGGQETQQSSFFLHGVSPRRCYLISFLWNPYRPAAVHTATQNAPTSHALPR